MATVEDLKQAQESAMAGSGAAPSPAGKNTARTDAINQMYDAQKTAHIKELESAYNQSMSDAKAAAEKIPGTYQQKANDLAVQYERNRRNFNQQAAGAGLNTGTASQAALAQNSTWQRDYGNLRAAQADAQAEADRGIANLTSRYQSSIAAAIADNDYKRAAALLDEYNNQYQRDMTQAQILAQFGDFTGYANLYGQEAADNMANVWKNENPGLAYNTGRITAEEYRSITGSYPPGYTPPASGGGWYGGYGGYGGGSGAVSGGPVGDLPDNSSSGSGITSPGFEQALNTARNLNNASPAKVNQALNAYMNSGAISEAEAQRIANSLRNNQNPRK